MYRNTLLLTIGLTIFAALVVGVNIGRKFTGSEYADIEISTTPVPQIISPSPTPSVQTLIYEDPKCGILLKYPSNYQKTDNDLGGAFFQNTQNQEDIIIVTCQKDIPRPALTEDRIEKFNIGSISATLYHDTNPKDGTPIDKIIFKHPKKTLDIYLSGMNNILYQMANKLQIL